MADSQSANKRSRLSSPFVTIKAGAGDDTQTFYVHEDLITEKSDFFQAAFKRQWSEGKSRMIELKDDRAEVVAAFLEWLYDSAIPTTHISKLGVPARKEQYKHLARLYVFGEKIQHDEFCNAVIRTILRKCDEQDEHKIRHHPIEEAVSIIYDGCPEGSLARQLMVHIHVTRGNETWLKTTYTEHHPMFMVDLARALFEAKAPTGVRGPLSEPEKMKQWLKEEPKKPE